MGYLCVLSSKQYAQLNPQKHLIFGHSIFFRVLFIIIVPVHTSLFLNKVRRNEFRNSVIKHHHHLFSIEPVLRNALEPIERLNALVLHSYKTRQKVCVQDSRCWTQNTKIKPTVSDSHSLFWVCTL